MPLHLPACYYYYYYYYYYFYYRGNNITDRWMHGQHNNKTLPNSDSAKVNEDTVDSNVTSEQQTAA